MPQFGQNYCAYHPNQQLTNFCTCVQCLLPVCPTCIKAHTQEHMQKGTHPEFQKLDNVFIEVYESCGNIMQGLERLKEQLLEVEKVKKQNQSLILEKIRLYRNKLIREFQRALTELEHQIVKKFQNQDENLIKQMEHIDLTIDKMEQDVQSQMIGLQSDQGLRRMIFNLSDNYEIRCLKELTVLNERIKEMLKRNVYLEVEEDRVEDVKISIRGYMKLGMIEWGIAKGATQLKPEQNNPELQNNNELTAFTREGSTQRHRSLIYNLEMDSESSKNVSPTTSFKNLTNPNDFYS